MAIYTNREDQDIDNIIGNIEDSEIWYLFDICIGWYNQDFKTAKKEVKKLIKEYGLTSVRENAQSMDFFEDPFKDA